MKKKILTVIMVCMMTLSLIGCNGGEQKNEDAKFKTVADVKDKRIGVLLGSVHDAYTAKNFPDATIFQYKSPSDLILAVKSRKIDAAFYTHETLLEILRDDKELGFVEERLFSTSSFPGHWHLF